MPQISKERLDALLYLAQAVEEAIVDAECDIRIFTGDGALHTPDVRVARQLARALVTTGHTCAAAEVIRQVTWINQGKDGR